MNQIQLEYLDNLEFVLANMVYDGRKKWAQALGPVVEWLQKGEPVMAVLEAEAVGLDDRVLNKMRNVFDVRKFS